MTVTARFVGSALCLASIAGVPAHAQQVIVDIEDPSTAKQAPVELSSDFIAALPATVSVGGNPAASPPPPSEIQYPLNVQHWEGLTPEGKIAISGILVDGLRVSGTFRDCETIDAESMEAGISEWMTNGDNSEAVMTVTAFIAYSVCPIEVPTP